MGGIFNPSGIELPDGSLMTIYRKEANHNHVDGYKNASAVPFLVELLKDEKSVVRENAAYSLGYLGVK